MRLSRLGLDRYGHFTGVSVPLDAAGGECDLHVLYGDNEAGKTTAYNGLLDLLFGIEAKTPYGWLHPPATMRVAARIEGAGGARDVVRLGTSRNLLDGAGHPSPEGLAPSELAGLDRATYRQMFSLDERTLAAGGESILKAEGDLGELLFSATAGLADFSRALAGLRSEGEAFYKTHGRKHALAEFKKRLADLKERKAAIDVLAATYVRLTANRDAARDGYERAAADRVRLRAELDKAGRHAAALPRLAEIAAARRDLEALPHVPPAPGAWRAELPGLQRAEIEARTRLDGVAAEIVRLAASLAEPPGDIAASKIAAIVGAADIERARHATAVKDLPDRRASLNRERAVIEKIATDLGRRVDEAPALPLPGATVDALRDAIETLSGIQAKCDEADAELGRSRQRLDEARAEGGGGDGGEPPARDALVAALGVLQGDDVGARVRVARRDHAAKAGALDRRMAELAPWRGTIEELAAIRLPCERVRKDLAERHGAAVAEAGRRDADVGRLEDEAARHSARCEALAGYGAPIDDATAAAVRSIRDGAWSDHLDAMDAASALTFERAMKADDETGANRISQADALAGIRAARLSLTAATADLAIARGRAQEARERRGDAKAAIDATLAALPGFEVGWTLEVVEDFAAARTRALEAQDELAKCQRDLGDALEDAGRVHGRLAQALKAAGEAEAARGDVAELAAKARGILDADARRRERAALVKRLEHDRVERERQARQAGGDRAQWDDRWRELLRGTWLEADANVARVRSALKQLDTLVPTLARHDDLADRVAKMEVDEAAFAKTVADWADAMGIEAGDGSTTTILRAVDRRIAAARDEEATRKTRSLDLEAARGRLAELTPEVDALAALKEEMTTRLGVASLADAALALEAAARRDELVARIGAIERDVAAICSSPDFAGAETELAAIDIRTLEDRRIGLAALCEDQDQLAQQRFADFGRAQEALDAVDGDAAAARLDEERRTVLLEIEEGTLSHLALQAGIVSAEVAVRLFRERHRSSMMGHASDVFRALTLGRYDGLVAQGAGGGEVLVGIAAGGGSRLSNEMSTATRNQLYLSLRIAGYREYAKTRRPPPFVLDDVLETFDDRRAEAALIQLHGLSGIGQVVYLTHHRHLCEIARRACPGAVVRELARP